MTSAGYVIGNGTSRRGFDLSKLDSCTTVGCNRAYKEFDPAYLVAIDREIHKSPVKAIERIIEDEEPRSWKFVTRFHFEKFWWMTVEGEKAEMELNLNRGFCHNSGMYGALLLSQILKLDTIYLIGMDFFRPTPDGKNDIYGGNFEAQPGYIKVWNHMFDGAPYNILDPDDEENPVKHGGYKIRSKFVRVGPIEDRDREFYDSEFENLEFIENFEDMPIVPE
jgi:hypothetical protein